MIQDAPSNPGAAPAPAPTAGESSAADAAVPVPSPVSAPPGIPTPVLKPGEVITWIKIERPRLELGQVLVGSFVLVGLIMAMAVFFGVVLGHLRSKSTDDAHGAGGLDLR